MLHHLLTILLLFAFSVAVAQEEETQEDDSKRPSWSAGLPERTKAADLNKPDFKPDNDIEIDMSDFGLQETTEIEMDLPIGETISVKAEKPTAEEIAAELANEELNAEDDMAAEETVAEEAVAAEVVDDNEVTVPATEPAAAEPVTEEQVVQEPAVTQPPAEELTDAATSTAVADTPPPVEEATTPAVEDTVADANEATGEEEAITEAVADTEAQAEPAMAQAEPTETDSTDTNTADAASNEIDQSIASIDPPVMTETLDPVAEAAETVTYQWEILQQAPVKYPVRAAMENQEGWVDVEVTIDPSGRVVSVSPVKYSTRGRIFGKPAVQSVNDWLFKPPSALGITENQTRIYKIEFEL